MQIKSHHSSTSNLHKQLKTSLSQRLVFLIKQGLEIKKKCNANANNSFNHVLIVLYCN